MSKNSEKIIHGTHYVTSPFGGRIHPITGKYEGHLGVDYGTNGQKIPCYALEDGYIHIAHYANSVGNYVFCEFPKLGMVGDYQHLDSFSVKEGQYVKKGQQIGIIGTTGDSTGVHLHFGLFPTSDLNVGWYNKHWVDFESYTIPEDKPVEGKFKIGDTVILNGQLYVSSTGTKKGRIVNGVKTIITRYNAGSKHPYNTTGDLGWMDESSISLYKDEGFKVGDNVVPITLVDYNGTRLVQYDTSYYITSITGDRAVLSANRNGNYYVWAALNINNIKKV